MPEQPRHPNPQPRWLSAAERETWQQFAMMLHRLPAALGAQLQQDADLSYIEYYVLAGLSDQPERRMRMSDLAVLAHSEQSRLSHMISRLERRGFVRREPDPTNGRYTHAILTDAGHAHLVEAAPGHVARVRDLVFDVLDPAELDNLRTAAQKISESIDRREQRK
ncbi:MarR family transcriptional regulator [Streptomyces sp900105755]|uniref:MarR family winged helix-turn-helix transcriptional regulator n=1 Tax=unclassified Streptomyces TaxID=2593676 RepID=UPI0008986C26|nr:MarR family transcriptional regulator [Streptomyces sp. Ag109_O5-10]SED70995.1 DNA-binding transcriptional regulator, MarR family [Streptomyces sp. Ag109_O5-10]